MRVYYVATALLAVVFIGLVFLVHEKDMSASIIEVFVSFLLGGGLTHLGTKLASGSSGSP